MLYNLTGVLISPADPVFTDLSKYVCTQPLSPDDYVTLMTIANPAFVSLEVVILRILITPSFLRCEDLGGFFLKKEMRVFPHMTFGVIFQGFFFV